MKCNECPVRLDIATANMPKERLRPPSGWLDLGDGAHVCSQCAAARWSVFHLPAAQRLQL